MCKTKCELEQTGADDDEYSFRLLSEISDLASLSKIIRLK